MIISKNPEKMEQGVLVLHLLKEEEIFRTFEDKLVTLLNQSSEQNFNDIEIKVGNDKENNIVKDQ